jgi:hypothetical protein
LQARDLLRSDTLPLTQEFLSQMLGVQRSSVTLVARKLQEAGLINYRRGRIHILDVEGLQDSCCESQRRAGADGLVSSRGRKCPAGEIQVCEAKSENTWAPFLAMPR